MQLIRKRLGLLVPAANIIMEHELYRSLPLWVSMHTTRISTKGGGATIEGLSTMVEESFQSAHYLTECKVDLICYGCTSGSFIEGKGFDRHIETEISKRTGLDVFSTSHAVLDLFAYLKIKRLSVLTPYIDEINQRILKFLEENGYKVLRLIGMSKVSGVEIGEIDLSTTFKNALEVDHPEADAIFISCTALRTFELIPLLKGMLGKTVITSNQASLWKIFQLFNIQDHREILLF